VVALQDIYAGQGLTGVPRGTVKQLRLFTYHFSYRGTGGQWDRVGMDGPWEPKRVLEPCRSRTTAPPIFACRPIRPSPSNRWTARGKRFN